MFSLLLALAFAMNSTASQDDKPVPESRTTPPKPNPLAPSLRATTEEEEDKFDKIVDRFILYDTGQLKGPEAKKALVDFQKLPPEAVFALIRGLNRAAAIEHSCPALVIAKRLAMQVRSTTDRDLIQFARENIGAGVKSSRHMPVIRDLKLACTMRQSSLDNLKSPDFRGSTKP